MARARTQFVCTECGGSTPKWAGRCPQCSAWNTLQESVVEVPRAGVANRFAPLAASGGVQMLDEVVAAEVPRFSTGKRSEMIECEGGEEPASPTPTPMRASASWKKLPA